MIRTSGLGSPTVLVEPKARSVSKYLSVLIIDLFLVHGQQSLNVSVVVADPMHTFHDAIIERIRASIRTEDGVLVIDREACVELI